ncbi:hypothetical protein F4861DRAFT_301657 [Xylaria intraflava]|nr:hypothetical protein F4861DRAFT_301657 [Xylaria intraflava]
MPDPSQPSHSDNPPNPSAAPHGEGGSAQPKSQPDDATTPGSLSTVPRDEGASVQTTSQPPAAIAPGRQPAAPHGEEKSILAASQSPTATAPGCRLQHNRTFIINDIPPDDSSAFWSFVSMQWLHIKNPSTFINVLNTTANLQYHSDNPDVIVAVDVVSTPDWGYDGWRKDELCHDFLDMYYETSAYTTLINGSFLNDYRVLGTYTSLGAPTREKYVLVHRAIYSRGKTWAENSKQTFNGGLLVNSALSVVVRAHCLTGTMNQLTLNLSVGVSYRNT